MKKLYHLKLIEILFFNLIVIMVPQCKPSWNIQSQTHEISINEIPFKISVPLNFTSFEKRERKQGNKSVVYYYAHSAGEVSEHITLIIGYYKASKYSDAVTYLRGELDQLKWLCPMEKSQIRVINNKKMAYGLLEMKNIQKVSGEKLSTWINLGIIGDRLFFISTSGINLKMILWDAKPIQNFIYSLN